MSRAFLHCLGAACLVCLCPGLGLADGVIGVSGSLSVPVGTFLVAKHPDEVAGVQMFNYFFTVELLVGMVAAYIRQIIKVFPGA